MMYTDEELEKLEEEEHDLTLEAFALLLLSLDDLSVDIETELRSFYQRYGADGVVTYQDARKRVGEKNRQKRMFVLFALIADTFDRYFVTFAKRMRRHLTSVVETEATYFDVELDVDKILSMTWGIDDLNWESRFISYKNKWVSVISNDLKTHFLRRSNIDDVLKDITKRFDTMENIIWKLYVTETTALGSLARQQIFKELGVKKYRYYTREDERTCEQCGALHGKVFPIEAFEVGVTASPLHPHCRCFEIPITE